MFTSAISAQPPKLQLRDICQTGFHSNLQWFLQRTPRSNLNVRTFKCSHLVVFNFYSSTPMVYSSITQKYFCVRDLVKIIIAIIVPTWHIHIRILPGWNWQHKIRKWMQRLVPQAWKGMCSMTYLNNSLPWIPAIAAWVVVNQIVFKP